MKKTTFLILAVYCLKLPALAQFCNSNTGTCYQKDVYFEESQIRIKDYKYATVHNIYGSATASVDLYMTVYSPCNLPDAFNDTDRNIPECKDCKRPFILMIHGGGFRIGCRTAIKDECMEFAKRGYVAAAIDYRIGWVPGDELQTCSSTFCLNKECFYKQEDSCNTKYKDSINFAMYRAFQDAAAAMRFIVHYAGGINIDTNYLYLDGHSAGAIIANTICYMSQAEVNKTMPAVRGVLGLVNKYGNSFTETYKIAGLFNNWGSLSDTNYIKGIENKIPMIAFHGIDDPIVPYAKGAYLSCANASYGYTYGSNCMYNRLLHKYPDLPVELYACYGGHGIFDENPETDQKSLYRIQKAVCFFYRLRMRDRTQKFISISKKESDITYKELDSISPVSCTVYGSQDLVKLHTDGKDGNIGSFNKIKPAGFLIYPNPAIYNATLLINGELQEMNISIIKTDGRVIWRRLNVREKTISLPVRELPNGLYLVIIQKNKYSKVLKLIKHNPGVE